MPPRSGAISGSDMVINDSMLLHLYRDGRQSPVQGGRFGQVEAGQGAGGAEHPLVFDNLTGGIGSSERLVPNSYPLAINGTTRFGRTWMPSGEQIDVGAFPNGSGGRPAGEITSMVVQGSDLLVAAGGVLYRLSYPYTTPVPEYTVNGTEWIQDVILYNGLIVVGTRLGDGTPGRVHVKQGSTWTASTTANRQHLRQAYFTINNVGDWRLISNDTLFSFKFIVATTAAQIIDDLAWSSDAGAGYKVGDGDNPITNIVGAPLVVFFTTTNGLWHVKEDGRSAQIADWSSSIHPSNGKTAFFMFGGVYASHGRDGLVRVDVASLQTQWQEQACSPGFGFPRVTPLNGVVGALASDGDNLVASQFNGTDSHISYGRPNELAQRLALADIRSPQAMNWHGSEITRFGERVTCLLQASIGTGNRPLMWVGSVVTSGGAIRLSHTSLPDQSTPIEDLVQNGSHRFNTQSWLYLPLQDFGDENRRAWATSRKIFTRLEMTGKYVQRYVSWVDAYMTTSSDYEIFWDRAVEGDSTLWTMVGRLDNGQQINIAPPPATQSGVHAGIMFRGYGEPDKPFVWTGTKLRGVPLLELAERRRYRVVVGRVRKANRAVSLRDRQGGLQEIFALQWSDPVKLYDHTGTTLIVQIEEGVSYEETWDDKNKDWVTVVTFNCRVVRRPFFWGSGYRWGSDIVWS